MNKILINIYIPVLDYKFDIYIPNNCKVGVIKTKINEIISTKYSNNIIIDSQNMRLLNRENGLEYDTNIYIHETTIKNGSILVLI